MPNRCMITKLRQRPSSAVALGALLSSLSLATPAIAEENPGVEQQFVDCLAEKQPDLIVQIRDAESQEGFEAGMKTALEVCPTETDAMSMAKLFRALNAYKEEGSDA